MKHESPSPYGESPTEADRAVDLVTRLVDLHGAGFSPALRNLIGVDPEKTRAAVVRHLGYVPRYPRDFIRVHVDRHRYDGDSGRALPLLEDMAGR